MVNTPFSLFFFFNDTATTEIYTLSLHDALPICQLDQLHAERNEAAKADARLMKEKGRSEEHTSELQSRLHLVCRLLLEKKKNADAADRSETLIPHSDKTILTLVRRSSSSSTVCA